MWFANLINVPDILIDALDEDRLTVFVGAGASLRPPSSLPLFDNLAREVAINLGFEPYAFATHGPPDGYLERIERELAERLGHGVYSVREHVARILGPTNSAPNDVHDAIVGLFTTADSVRLVTTNYDRHLEAAAYARFGEVPRVYSAPALPRGDDFHGIVHLHGSLSDRLTDLVVTSRDFGRAYLTEAWAARFLNDLFREYKTLFIGYSHDDVVMRYLAQGLKDGTVRYGLLDDQVDGSGWRPIDLQPVPYPAANDHEAVPVALAAWGGLRAMGMLDHEQRVRQEVGGGLPSLPDATSYLERIIASDKTAVLFQKYAKGPEWLGWLEQRPPFPSLFDRNDVRLSAAGYALAGWLADTIANHSEEVLDAVQRHGGHLNRSTAELIALSFHQHQPDPRVLGRWVVLLVETRGSEIDRLLTYLLLKARWPDDRETALVLFARLTEIDVTLRPRFRARDDDIDATTEYDVESLASHEYELKEAWDRVLKPHLDEIVMPLARILEYRIASAHVLLRAARQANSQFDALSFIRTSIAPDAQNGHPRHVDFLVDALRKCIEYLLANAPENGSALMALLGASDVPLLRRFSVFGWTIRTDRSPEQKLQYLVESGNLFAFPTRREVYRLIETVAPEASDARGELLAAILRGPSQELSLGEDHDPQMIFELLSWLAEKVPDDAEVASALEAMREARPDMQAAEHPGYDRWTESNFGTTSPVTAEELRGARSVGDIAALLQEHATSEPDTFFAWTFRIPETVAAAAADDPSWAITLMSDILTTAAWDHPFWSPLLDGLGRADLSESELRSRVLSVLADAIGIVGADVEAGVLLPAVGDFLLGVVRAPELPRELLEWIEDLGLRLARVVYAGPDAHAVEGVERVFESSFNHWCGRLIRFWVDAVRLRWAYDRETWSGLPDKAREAVETLLALAAPKSIPIHAVAAGYFPFFVAADDQWAVANLRPMFDWADESESSNAWSSFIANGQADNRVLTLLAPYLAQTFERAPGELGLPIARWLGSIVIRSSVDLFGEGIVRAFVQNYDIDERISFAESVAWQLHAVASDFAQAQWDRWIEQYLRDRLASTPLPLEPAEAGALLRWITMAGDRFPTAVNLFLTTNARFTEVFALSSDIRERQLIEHFPIHVARLIEFVLQRCDPGTFFDCAGIGEMLDELIPLVGGEGRAPLIAICEAAASLYCTDAAAWRGRVIAQYPNPE